MLEMHDAIKDLPGSTPARRLMVQRALEYLDKMAQEADDDAPLQSDLAIAFERVGDVQGNPQNSNLGDTRGALESYRKALTIRENLPPEIQNAATEKYAAAMLYGKKFQAAVFQLDMQTAEIYCRRALRLLENLAADEPENITYRNALANSYSSLGELKKKDRNFAEALDSLNKTIEISDEILKRDAVNADALSNTQLAFVRIGEIHEIEKNLEATLAAYQNALSAAKKAAAAYPQNATLDLVLGISYGKVGYTQAAAGNSNEATANSRTGLGILQKIVAADPENTFADRQLACAFKNVGFSQLQSGDANAALENFQKALAIKEKLRKKDNSDVYLVGDIGEILAFHGDAYKKAASGKTNFQSKREDLNNARNWYQRSLEIWLNLQREGKLPQYYSSKPDELKTLVAHCDKALKNSAL